MKLFLVCVLLVLSTEAKKILIKNGGLRALEVAISGLENVIIQSHKYAAVKVPENFNGKIEAWYANCVGTDCEGPRTSANFDLTEDPEVYYVSVIDGFNLPMKIAPVGGILCLPSLCQANLLKFCPEESQVISSSNQIIGCQNPADLMKKFCPLAVVEMFDAFNIRTCKGAKEYLLKIG